MVFQNQNEKLRVLIAYREHSSVVVLSCMIYIFSFTMFTGDILYPTQTVLWIIESFICLVAPPDIIKNIFKSILAEIMNFKVGPGLAGQLGKSNYFFLFNSYIINIDPWSFTERLHTFWCSLPTVRKLF